MKLKQFKINDILEKKGRLMENNRDRL